MSLSSSMSSYSTQTSFIYNEYKFGQSKKYELNRSKEDELTASVIMNGQEKKFTLTGEEAEKINDLWLKVQSNPNCFRSTFSPFAFSFFDSPENQKKLIENNITQLDRYSDLLTALDDLFINKTE